MKFDCAVLVHKNFRGLSVIKTISICLVIQGKEGKLGWNTTLLPWPVYFLLKASYGVALVTVHTFFFIHKDI